MKNYIREYYTKIYEGKHAGSARLPVVRGKGLAAELGYPAGILQALPEEIWDDFLPCGNVLPYVRPEKGERVLNLGCGIGVDSFALKLSVAAEFQVVSLDAVFAVLSKGSRFAKKAFPNSQLDFVCADGVSLPFMSESFEWIILNGVFNLFPEKSELTGEIERVLRTGGTVVGADLCRRVVLPDYFASEPDAWAWCMSGALSEEELSAAFESRGFRRKVLRLEQVDDFFDRVLFSFEKAG